MIACPGQDAASSADGVCERIAADFLRRTTLTQSTIVAATPILEAAKTAINGLRPADACVQAPPDTSLQSAPPCRISFGVTEASAVKAALNRLGLDASVRLAGAGDPAPPGSILLGAHVTDACLIGYAGADIDLRLAGQLPDGSCLS